MKLLVAVVALAYTIYGTDSHGTDSQRCKAPVLTDQNCTKDCKNALVEKMKVLPFGCNVNIGACRPIRCATKFDKGCNRFNYCRPRMEKKTFVCNDKEFVEEVVSECKCTRARIIVVIGRVVERLNDGEGSIVAGVETALLSLSVNGFNRRIRADENGFFIYKIKFCLIKIVITASKDGYVSTMKVLDIADDTLGVVENVQIVLFRLAAPVQLIPNEENILQTSGAARVIIPDWTTFVDENGNEVGDNVNAILNFIDPSNDNFDDAPGIFVTDGGEQLMSFGVLNLRFQDDDGNNLLPEGNIRIALADTEETDYKLWTLNNEGEWEKKNSSGGIGGGQGGRKKRQTDVDDLGSFGRGDIGTWINVDKIPNADPCFVKTRVFKDVSFAAEVPDGGVDNYQPKFLLKVGNNAPFQGLNLYRSPTDSPGQTCFEVRCGDDPKMQGFLTVFAQETIGNGQSIPVPAIPVQLGNSALPVTLNTKLGSLNYLVNADETEARLDFFSSAAGPLYTDKTVCEQSALTDNSLWFARRQPIFSNTDFGNDFCYARIWVYQRGPGAIQYLDQIKGTSVWGAGPYYYADSLVQNNDFVYIPPHEFACLRYRCSEINDLTTVYLQAFGTNENVTCSTGQFTAPELNVPNTAYGYYQGLDENEAKEECLAETDIEKAVSFVSCYIGQGGSNDTTGQ